MDQDRAAINAVIERLAGAIRSKDVDAAMSVFALDVVSFDLGPPLQHGSGDVFRRHWQALFDVYQGPIDYELRDVELAVSGDVAFSHSLNRIGGVNLAGARVDLWLRWTACYRRINETWLIVHEHVSVPADLRTGKAVLDLKP
jgi:ketosteroid isomerase-like protein